MNGLKSEVSNCPDHLIYFSDDIVRKQSQGLLQLTTGQQRPDFRNLEKHMTPWNEVKSLALTLVQQDWPEETMESLETWILSSGYQGALHSHERTRDLIYVYSASLRNAGGPGPVFDKFAQMIAFTVDRYWIVENVLQEFDLADLARRCLQSLESHDVEPMAKNSRADYPDQLRRMAVGENVSPRIMQPLLESVVEFSKLIREAYGGTATRYHHAFIGAAEEPSRFALQMFLEIAEFPKIGIAVGMNFFKDSQAPSIEHISGAPIHLCSANRIAWFVKPDKHVSRLMLCTTGRSKKAGLDNQRLTYLEDSVCFDTYSRTLPANGFSGQYVTQPAQTGVPQWRCVEDVHEWALLEGIAAIEIDRILYLIGSGRYGRGKLSTEQSVRYRRFCELIDGYGGTPVLSPTHPTVPIRSENLVRTVDPNTIGLTRRNNSPSDVRQQGVASSSSAKDAFISSVRESTSACSCVNALIDHFSGREDVQIHYTFTSNCDLRIRALNPTANGRISQNVFVMTWRRSGFFDCLIFDIEDESQLQAAEVENLRPKSGTLKTAFQFHPLGSNESSFILASLIDAAIDNWMANR